ncbi:MAG: lysophospholipid acyltransferase family protein [Gemmatimonadota bacterium]
MSEVAPGFAARTGRGLARVMHSGLRLRRDLVESQIAESFPERGPDWVSRTGRACYRHFGEEFALLAGGRRAIEAAIPRIDATGVVEDLYRIAGGSAASVVVTGHIGNWELAAAYAAVSGVPVTAVARRQGGRFGRRLHAVREAAGVEIIDHDGGAGPVIRALRAGRCVTLVADQHAIRGARPMPFLGRPAWTRLGPARLAAAAGVPLVFAALLREDEGYRFEWRPLPREVVEDEDAVTVTRMWVSYLEEAVKRRPEQYFWFHERWKQIRQQ